MIASSVPSERPPVVTSSPYAFGSFVASKAGLEVKRAEDIDADTSEGSTDQPDHSTEA